MHLLPSGKAQFNWAVSADLRKQFDEICEAKGYQKQAHVERMLKRWINEEMGIKAGVSLARDGHPVVTPEDALKKRGTNSQSVANERPRKQGGHQR